MSQPNLFFLGSLPHGTPQEAIAFVQKYSGTLPFLPQLPEANPEEDMVGQVLRGISLQCWDERSASCLELFQNHFVESSRFKIQVAGPYTVARAMSEKFQELAPMWILFWQGLKNQLKEAGFQGELWLQLDEPFWSAESDLPDGYTAFLQRVREVGGELLKLGIHSCASQRPKLFVDHIALLDFFAFSFEGQALSFDEEREWEHLMAQRSKELIFGASSWSQTENPPWPQRLRECERFWVSDRCGFYGRSVQGVEKDLSQFFGGGGQGQGSRF